jgi:hypothetical protein
VTIACAEQERVAWACQITMSYLNTHHWGGKHYRCQTKDEQAFLPGCDHVQNHFLTAEVGGAFLFLIIGRDFVAWLPIF